MYLLSILSNSFDLCFFISLKHAASEVICSNLVASNSTVVHLVEPLICRLFNAILVAVLALLFGQIEPICYLFVEWATEGLLRSIFSPWSKMVFWQERL